MLGKTSPVVCLCVRLCMNAGRGEWVQNSEVVRLVVQLRHSRNVPIMLGNYVEHKIIEAMLSRKTTHTRRKEEATTVRSAASCVFTGGGSLCCSGSKTPIVGFYDDSF